MMLDKVEDIYGTSVRTKTRGKAAVDRFWCWYMYLRLQLVPEVAVYA